MRGIGDLPGPGKQKRSPRGRRVGEQWSIRSRLVAGQGEGGNGLDLGGTLGSRDPVRPGKGWQVRWDHVSPWLPTV